VSSMLSPKHARWATVVLLLLLLVPLIDVLPSNMRRLTTAYLVVVLFAVVLLVVTWRMPGERLQKWTGRFNGLCGGPWRGLFFIAGIIGLVILINRVLAERYIRLDIAQSFSVLVGLWGVGLVLIASSRVAPVSGPDETQRVLVAGLSLPLARTRDLAIGLTISLVTLLLGAVLFEVALRTQRGLMPKAAWSYISRRGWLGYSVKIAKGMVYDRPAVLGHVMRPNGPEQMLTIDNMNDPALLNAQDYTAPDWPRETVQMPNFFSDEFGFHNRTPLKEHYDIVITGDSFTQRSAPVIWPEVLEERTGLSVYNLGMSVWSTQAEVAAVRKYGFARTPQWVVLLYFEGNDLQEAHEYQQVLESGLSERVYEWRENGWVGDLLLFACVKHYWNKANLLPAASSANAKTSSSSREYAYPVTAVTENGNLSLLFHSLGVLALDRASIESSGNLPLVEHSLLGLRDDCRARGIRFLLVYAPMEAHVYYHLVEDQEQRARIMKVHPSAALGADGFIHWQWPSRVNQAAFEAHMDDQRDVLRDFAQANDIEFLDLVPVMQAAAAQGENLYWYADTHWRDAGHRVAGETIADYVMTAQESIYAVE
jgi:hypothetical protein